MNWKIISLPHGCAVVLMCVLAGAAVAGDVESKVNENTGEELVLIPAGLFVMGSNRLPNQDESTGVGTIKPWYLDEHPEHKVDLPAYYIDRYEITNAEYQKFVAATGHTPPISWGQNGYLLNMRLQELGQLDIERLRHLAVRTFRLDMDTRTMDKKALLDAITKRVRYLDKEPITNVSWHDADAYCTWTGEHLPSEAEWEKAARGADGNEYPWGDKWATGRSNTGEEMWDDGVAPVGSYPSDKSPFGVFDMAGNVSEWVIANPRGGRASPAIKGSSFEMNWSVNACFQPMQKEADWKVWYVGFRCAR